jgi:hypothetical protein
VAVHHRAQHHFLGQLVGLPIPPSAPPAPCRRRPGSAWKSRAPSWWGSARTRRRCSPRARRRSGLERDARRASPAAEAPIIAGMSESTSG